MIPCLIGCSWCGLGRTAILEMYDRFGDFEPEVFWDIHVRHDRLRPFDNCAICPLADAVLIRTVWCRDLLLDAALLEICFESLFIFSAAITPKPFDLSSQLILHMCL